MTWMTLALLLRAFSKARTPFISRYACVLPRPWAQRDDRLVEKDSPSSRLIATNKKKNPGPSSHKQPSPNRCVSACTPKLIPCQFLNSQADRNNPSPAAYGGEPAGAIMHRPVALHELGISFTLSPWCFVASRTGHCILLLRPVQFQCNRIA
jgi:hypothetical protein